MGCGQAQAAEAQAAASEAAPAPGPDALPQPQPVVEDGPWQDMRHATLEEVKAELVRARGQVFKIQHDAWVRSWLVLICMPFGGLSCGKSACQNGCSSYQMPASSSLEAETK